LNLLPLFKKKDGMELPVDEEILSWWVSDCLKIHKKEESGCQQSHHNEAEG
jgi:hypothetical protein